MPDWQKTAELAHAVKNADKKNKRKDLLRIKLIIIITILRFIRIQFTRPAFVWAAVHELVTEGCWLLETSAAAVMCIFFFFFRCQTPLGEGSNILYCMCSSHHNHSTPTAFFNISTLKTNRVTTTSSCRLFFFSLSFSLHVSLMSAFQEHRSSTQKQHRRCFLSPPFPQHPHKEGFQFLMHRPQREDAQNKRERSSTDEQL